MSSVPHSESFLAVANRRLPRLRARAEWLQGRIREKEADGRTVAYEKADLSALVWAIAELSDRCEIAKRVEQEIESQRSALRSALSALRAFPAIASGDVYRVMVELRASAIPEIEAALQSRRRIPAAAIQEEP